MAADAWLSQIGSVCLWGSVLIAAVGLLCRFAPRLPAALRAWLWWLACAKVLVDFCVVTPISLPVLPASIRTAHSAFLPTARSLERTVQPRKKAVFTDAPPAFIAGAQPEPVPVAPRWPLGFFAAWLVGVAVSFLLVARQSLLLHRLRRGTYALSLPEMGLGTLCRQMGLRRLPPVLTGPNVHTPCVAGWLRPVVLLPLGLSQTLSASEMRLMLAHEMAHVKRADLPLAIVPMLARILLFFSPFAWWAAAEWAAAREEACDAQALSATSLSPADYGRLLLKLAAPTAAAPALGLSPGYHGLRRRLTGLTRAQRSTRGMRLLAFALPLLLPWRLTTAPTPAEAQRGQTAPASYAITALANGMDGEAAALNDAGQIALTVQEGGTAQGYVGNVDALAALGTLPKHHGSLAYGINPLGEVAGTSFNILGHGRAFFWDGAAHRLGSLPGYPYSEARGLNNAGQVAGFSETGSADRWHAWITRAFIHQPGGPIMDLGTLGGSYSAAYGINSSGRVVGKADTEAFGATHAFAWSEGRMTDLGTLGGANSVAHAVNDQGAIAGASEVDSAGTRHAFLSADGIMHDLGTLPTLTSSAAYALNNAGQIVGVSQSSSGDQDKRATLWQNDEPIDLNTLLPPHSGWTLTEAHAVNDHGQIAGIGLFHGHRRAFLLTPH